MASDPAVGRPRRVDPWAHRRGEPRVFAFFWTMYLLAATIFTLAALGLAEGTSRESYRSSARLLLIVTLVGIAWLWPMTRLTQARPRQDVRSAFAADLAIVSIPTLAITLPQWLLAGWALGTVGAVSAIAMGWCTLVAGTLALAFAGAGPDRPGRPARLAWMLLLIAASIAAPALALLTGRAAPDLAYGYDIPVAWAAASPFTAVLEVTRTAGGTIAPVGPHLAASAVAGGLGVALALLSLARGR